MGLAIIFVISLAGDAVVGGVFLLYASHCFLTVLADSSGGIDEVRWPDEGVADWFVKGAYCVWTLVFWVMTAGVTLAPFVVRSEGGYVVFVVTVVALMHPIGVLSSLSTRNWFFQVSPSLLLQLARHPRAVAVAYLTTLPVLAAAGALVFAAYFRSLVWIFPASFVLAGAIILYARAWGQLAWLAMNWEKPAKRSKEDSPDERAVAVADPWPPPPVEADDVPELDVEEIIDDPHGKRLPPEPVEEEEGEWTINKKPYGLVEDSAPAAAAEEAGQAVAAGPPPPNRAKQLTQYLDEDHQKNKARTRRTERLNPTYDRRPPTFQRAMGRRLFLFLFYPLTLQAWLTLALGALLALGMFYITLSTVPPI